MPRTALVLSLSLLLTGAANAQKKNGLAFASEEDKYYKLLSFDVPTGEVLEASAIEMMPDGKVKEEIFKADKLHMNPAGYVLWRDVLKPILMSKEMVAAIVEKTPIASEK